MKDGCVHVQAAAASVIDDEIKSQTFLWQTANAVLVEF
jgi:hypothetical protein